MHWAGLIAKYRLWLALGAAVLGHGVLVVFVLSLPRPALVNSLAVIAVELVTVTAPEPEPEEPEPEPGAEETLVPIPEASPEERPRVPDPAPEEIPFVALSDETDAAERVVPGRQTVIDPTPAEKEAERVRAGTRQALHRVRCRKLAEKPDPACPKGDPFYEQEQLAALRNAPPVRKIGVGPRGPGNYAEAFLAKNRGFPPKMLNGEDNSIFIEPMRKGAYNAQRIRNGEAPIWSRDLQRDLEQQRRD